VPRLCEKLQIKQTQLAKYVPLTQWKQTERLVHYCKVMEDFKAKELYFFPPFFEKFSREHFYGPFYTISNRLDFIGNKTKYPFFYKVENKNNYPRTVNPRLLKEKKTYVCIKHFKSRSRG
jgi:hypothetical protein